MRNDWPQNHDFVRKLAHAKRELQASDADTLSKATLTNLRINPGADVIVRGSYMPVETMPDDPRIDLQEACRSRRSSS